MIKQLLSFALVLTLIHTQFSDIRDSVEITTPAQCACVKVSHDG